jgi:hypothetical protein
MSAALQASTKQMVLSVLSEQATKSIDFTLAGTHVAPNWYKQVYDAIVANQITVTYDSGLAPTGAYLPTHATSADAGHGKA